MQIEPDARFVLHPTLFSEQVVRTIESDFTVFTGTGTRAPQLPHVVAVAGPATGLNVPPTVLSTRT